MVRKFPPVASLVLAPGKKMVFVFVFVSKGGSNSKESVFFGVSRPCPEERPTSIDTGFCISCYTPPEQPRLGVVEDSPYLGQDRHSVGGAMLPPSGCWKQSGRAQCPLP